MLTSILNIVILDQACGQQQQKYSSIQSQNQN